MKPDEKLAYPYLVSLGLGTVVHEPEPNKPPDFLVNESIAVEVRRLNQNWITDEGYEGLEKLRADLDRQIPPVLASLGGPSDMGASWAVFYDFERPVPPWKLVRKALVDYLTAFRASEPLSHTGMISAQICPRFEIMLHRVSKHRTSFVLGGSSDSDTTCFVIPEMLKNLTICVNEKTQKTAPFWEKYPVWWLVLIDRIGYWLDANDRSQLRKHFQLKHEFDKIILLNAENPMSAFDLTASA